MANGAAILQSVSEANASDAIAAPSEPIEIRKAMVEAVATVSQGMLEWSNGGLTSGTRERGAEAISKLWKLSQASSGFDFAAVARREGKRAVQARYAAIYNGEVLPERLANILVDGTLEIVAKVTEAMANPRIELPLNSKQLNVQ